MFVSLRPFSASLSLALASLSTAPLCLACASVLVPRLQPLSPFVSRASPLFQSFTLFIGVAAVEPSRGDPQPLTA